MMVSWAAALTDRKFCSRLGRTAVMENQRNAQASARFAGPHRVRIVHSKGSRTGTVTYRGGVVRKGGPPSPRRDLREVSRRHPVRAWPQAELARGHAQRWRKWTGRRARQARGEP